MPRPISGYCRNVRSALSFSATAAAARRCRRRAAESCWRWCGDNPVSAFPSRALSGKACPRLIRAGIRLSVRKCDNAKMQDRFLSPANVIPLWFPNGAADPPRKKPDRLRLVDGTEVGTFLVRPSPSKWFLRKYPPAKPGALGSEPLKAAISGDSLRPLLQGPFSLDCLEQAIPFPERHFVCGASRDIAAIAAVF
jgi:hypothetical protein